ncbi:MAG: hypothetical protein AAGL24_16120 [Pseudomonadota bacterium]
MPNFDAGSYFLTILAPIKEGDVPAEIRNRSGSWDARFRDAVEKTQAETAEGATDNGFVWDDEVSWKQRLRMVLATLPTALQSPATERIGVQSPFARNRRNHLCRFVVIDDVVYNGRVTAKPIIGGGGDPLVPQPVDHLPCSYLLFAADIDAVTEEGASLPAELTERQQGTVRDAYLTALWDSAEAEMRAVFENCTGFDEVDDAASFVRAIRRCQIETTMPFHDYYTRLPALPSLPFDFLKLLVLGPLAVFALALIIWLGGSALEVILNRDWNLEGAFWTMLAALGVTAATAAFSYNLALKQGNKPFPPPPDGDLTSVLKALYLQQHFSDFVVAQQGAGDKDLHKAFGTFLKEHKPEDRTGPTQKPGYVSARFPGAVNP